MKALIALAIAMLPALARAEPFGSDVVTQGPIARKWMAASEAIRTDLLSINDCHNVRSACSPATSRILSVAETARDSHGLTRLSLVNRAINMMVRPQDDVIDNWSGPIATMRDLRGDCEDYAIAKMVALYVSGVSFSDMRIVILRELRRFEDHAVLSVRLNGRWYVLDNRHLAVIEDHAVRGYMPLASFTFEMKEN